MQILGPHLGYTSCANCDRKRCTACYVADRERDRKLLQAKYVLCMDKNTGKGIVYPKSR